jgi:hypothetical protein
MTAEQDPGQGTSGSTGRDDLGETPSWEDTPAREPREPRREDTSAGTAGREEPSGAQPAPVSPAEARSRARQEGRRRSDSPNMLPGRRGRPIVERLLVRLIATAGIVGIGVAIAAIMVSSNSQGWVVGLVVSIVSVVLAAILWSSRTL